MDKKNLERIKRSRKQEQAYVKKMQAEYNKAYKDIKRQIAIYIASFSKNGVMDANMLKYDRFDKIVRNIISNMAEVKTSTPTAVTSYLKDVYIDSYLYTGYAMETSWQAKIGYKEIARSKINPLNLMNNVSLTNNSAAVRNNLRQAISISINKGEGIGETSARLKNVLEKNMNNALSIARTETTTAMNRANLDGMIKASQVLPVQKQWIATLDSKTRRSHGRLDGETVDLDKKFSNGLMYPGDPTGRAEEVINCRCDMLEVVEGYEDRQKYRRERGLDGKNRVIPYTTYTDWAKNRL